MITGGCNESEEEDVRLNEQKGPGPCRGRCRAEPCRGCRGASYADRPDGAGRAEGDNHPAEGEVAEVQGDYLLVKMAPRGDYRLFQLRPGKTATIDGVVMPLNKVKPGTVLTAYVTVTERSVVDQRPRP